MQYTYLLRYFEPIRPTAENIFVHDEERCHVIECFHPMDAELQAELFLRQGTWFFGPISYRRQMIDLKQVTAEEVQLVAPIRKLRLVWSDGHAVEA
jgi:hypothetical protein